MLLTLPDHNTLYRALQARDIRYDGSVFVCISTAGVFCRLSCPARDPLPENCNFVETVAECLQSGFRACKRCHPLAGGADPLVQTLLQLLEADPQRLWGEDLLRDSGYDPFTVRRAFKRQYGITFLEMARLGRIRTGFESAAQESSIVDAHCAANFESDTAFRRAFGRWLGRAPGNFSANGVLQADWIDTPLGPVVAVSDRQSLHLLEFIERKALPSELKKLSERFNGDIGFGRLDPTDQIATDLERYFSGDSARFETRLAPHGTPFTLTVWDALREIPAGETLSYSELATAVGKPAAIRAVARANGANPFAIVIPCHRVLGADGSLTGYGGGLWRKRRLIELEGLYRKPIR